MLNKFNNHNLAYCNGASPLDFNTVTLEWRATCREYYDRIVVRLGKESTMFKDYVYKPLGIMYHQRDKLFSYGWWPSDNGPDVVNEQVKEEFKNLLYDFLYSVGYAFLLGYHESNNKTTNKQTNRTV